MPHVDTPKPSHSNGVLVTPAWSPSKIDISLSPTWNPSARTPLIVNSGSETPVTSTSTIFQHASATVPATAMLSPAHPLLDPHLVGKAAWVTVSAGLHPKKDALVSTLPGQNNKVAIQQLWCNQSFYLQPERVTLQHPNPTHDSGLLVVIWGDYCGKYVHRIHHHYDNNNRVVHSSHFRVIFRSFSVSIFQKMNSCREALPYRTM